MGVESPRAALQSLSASEFGALMADVWSALGWSVTIGNGTAAGADMLVTREAPFFERGVVVLVPGSEPIEAAHVQRAVGIRDGANADIAIVIGTVDAADEAGRLARQETLNVKLIDGWDCCRLLEENDLLGRLPDGPEDTSTASSEPTASTTDSAAASEPSKAEANGTAAESTTASHAGQDASTGTEATARESEASESAGGDGEEPEGPSSESDAERGVAVESTDDASADETAAEDDEADGAAANETPCPECGEPIFEGLINQGVACPYCDAEFEKGDKPSQF
jgi:hypothetical protein